jgi:diaminopimelate epimerase
VTDFVHRRGLTQQTQLSWNSKGGIVRTAIHDDGMIETWLPEPQFQYARVPFQHSEADRPPGQCVALETEHGEVQIVPVSLGNPHGVVFVDDVIELDVVGIGHALSHHEAFPERANIGFCQIVNKGFIRLRVFERGASETLACGSGASAAVAVGCQTGQLNSKVKVSLPGGKLRVEWPNSKGLIKLVGDSTFVYNGQLDI